jgi:hypothetical protein
VKGDHPDDEEHMRDWNVFQKWEYPAELAFFENDKRLILNQVIGLKLHGGMTRTYPEKSFQLVARKKYGEKRLNYQFYPEKEIPKFKRIVLRTSGNDFRNTRFRDALSAEVAEEIGLDHQSYRYCILLINGEYWGIYNIREKLNEEFLKDNYGAHPDSTDILQGYKTVEHGSGEAYEHLLHYMKYNDPAFKENYDSITKLMDVDNYMKFMIVQLFISNIDSRGNIRFWRASNLDGRFRWILYDTDYGYGLSMKYNANFLHQRTSVDNIKWYNPKWCTFIMRRLLRNPQFKVDFINQYAYYMSTSLHTDSLLNKIDHLKSLLHPEMKRHLKDRNISERRWLASAGFVEEFVTKRPDYVYKYLQKEFELYDPLLFKIYNPQIPGTVLKISGNVFKDSVFEGKFFKNLPFDVEFVSNRFYSFKGWYGYSDTTSLITIKTTNDSVILTPVIERVKKSDLEEKIILNEIYFKYDSALLRYIPDWFELHNRTDQNLELNGFCLHINGHEYWLSDTAFLEDDSYQIFRCKNLLQRDTSFYTTGNFEQDQLYRNTYYLFDDKGAIVDSVLISRTSGKGEFTYSLKSPELDNDIAENWMLTINDTTPGKTNVIFIPPSNTSINTQVCEPTLYYQAQTLLTLVIFIISILVIITAILFLIKDHKDRKAK